MARRARGDAAPDAAVIAANAGLMPELQEELGLLAMLERVRGSSVGKAVRRPNPGPVEFPGYELVREIHRGGQGLVYEAVHAATGRHVAMKVMRDSAWGDDRGAERFEQEVRILGELEHPGIVKVQASGRHEGHVYCVMDLVDGVPLDTYAVDCTLTEKLELMAAVCDAVSAAHQKGVIHRDLKPANILVDGHGMPRILDFGLARMAPESGMARDMTEAGQFVGSMPWASPEQAAGELGRIDVRTDVYAIGVMLYQLITGRFPYAVEAGPRDVLDNILRAEPARPRAIEKSVPTDVEAIVLKCLAKDRARRYQSAAELAADLRRHLTGWPVTARPPSAIYQLSRFARRNKGVVASGVALAMVLAAGATGTVLALVRAMNAETLAKERLVQAQHEAATNDGVSRFLEDLLSMASPEVARGRDITMLREILDRARGEVDERYSARPDLRARLHSCIGASYFALGSLDEAEAEARAARAVAEQFLPAMSPERADANLVIGMVLNDRGRPQEAVTLLRECLDIRLRVAGPEDTANAKIALAAALADMHQWTEAEALNRDGLAMFRSLRPQRPEQVAGSLADLASMLYDTGRSTEALPLIDEAIAMIGASSDFPRLVNFFTSRSFILGILGRGADSERAAAQGAELAQRILPENHPDRINALMRLTVCRIDRGGFEEAEPGAQSALNAARSRFTLPSNRVGEAIFLVANCRRGLGHPEEAEPLYKEAIAAYPADPAACPVSITDPMCALGMIYSARGEFEPSLALLRDALDRRVAQYGEKDLRCASTMEDLALVLQRSGHLAEAATMADRSLKVLRALFPADHPRVVEGERTLARIYLAQGKPAEAAPLLEHLIRMEAVEGGADSWSVCAAMLAHASCLIRLHQFADAEKELTQVGALYPSARNRPADAPQRLAQQMADLYQAQGDPERASAFRELARPATKQQ